MIGGILIVGGLFLGMCTWMAFGDEDPRWVRGAIRNVVMIGGFFGAMIFIFWALEEYGYIS